MFRTIFEFLALMVFFAVARTVISGVMRMVAAATAPQGQEQSPQQQSGGGSIQSAGELRKDPVCGTFVPVSTSLKRVVNGETVYFCSVGCRDQFSVSAKA